MKFSMNAINGGRFYFLQPVTATWRAHERVRWKLY